MPDSPSGDSFERLTQRVGVVGGLIAALVGLNTLVTSCSREQSQRYAEFRSAAGAEEATWRGLYNDYLATFDKDISEPDRQKRLIAIADLANREPPTFREFRLGYVSDDTDSKAAAIDRIARMKQGLLKAIGNPASSGEQVVQAIAQNENRAAEATAIRPRGDSEAAQVVQQAAVAAARLAPSPTPLTTTQIIAAGDPKGWDIDLFWCASPDPTVAQQNYSTALDRARLLGAAADARRPIADGVNLGRIRLRVLPAASQGKLPNGLVYPSLGNGLQLRYEDRAPRNRNELGAAQAIQQLLNRHSPPTALVTAGTPTPWYMSMFVC